MTTVPIINSVVTPGEAILPQSSKNTPIASTSIKDNSVEAIKFIKEKLHFAFDEKSARTLFNYYAINSQTLKLQPPDVRKLLFDILCANDWPMVVPDESLDNVLHELCLNDHGCISWIEFKSFFVFLQDRPLMKLFQICTKLFTKHQLEYARLICIQPQTNDVNINTDNSNSNSSNNISDISYDRQPWHQAISELVPEATGIFIFFMSADSILALVVGTFDAALPETGHAEICMNDSLTYIAEMRAFLMSDVFPPIARAGGMKSKVARKLADTYVIAKKWDNKNFQLRAKTSRFVQNVNCKWKEIDGKYGVKQKINRTAENFMSAMKTFDEKHQISNRVSSSAKDFDTKYKLSEKAMSTMAKIKSNETFQKVSNKVSETVNQTLQTMNDISIETQQLVNAQEEEKKEGLIDGELLVVEEVVEEQEIIEPVVEEFIVNKEKFVENDEKCKEKLNSLNMENVQQL